MKSRGKARDVRGAFSAGAGPVPFTAGVADFFARAGRDAGQATS